MPAYSFQERFVPFIKDGSKFHTIRKRRDKGFAKKGDTLYLYYGLRTKHCTKLREEICTDVKTIIINYTEVSLCNRRINNEEFLQASLMLPYSPVGSPHDSYDLFKAEKELLAWRDGFRPEGTSFSEPWGSFELMHRWFSQTHELPFVGDIIYWEPK